MISYVLKRWYGDFSRAELKKYVLLGIIFAFILGTYWALNLLKDSLFGALIIGYGKSGLNKEFYLAWAKVGSLFFLFPLVIGYGKLVDKFHKHHIFYALGIFYTIALICWTFFFIHPIHGLSNTLADPWRIGGWLWYVFVESFGSLFVALFWAFTADITDPQTAKRAFPLVYLIGQLGGIIFPRYLSQLSLYFQTTNWLEVAVCAACTVLVMVMIRYFIATTPKELLTGYQAKSAVPEGKEEPGFLEGLKLLVGHRYLLGIFSILAFFELIVTIIEFNFKTMALAHFSSAQAANAYFGTYASAVHAMTFVCLALGINNITRWLGIRASLALVPVIVGGAVGIFLVYPQLTALFYIMVGAKAINYALNQPSLKQLYIPTSENAKYKSQAWIETFGSRSAKAAASFLNVSKSFIGSPAYFVLFGLFSTSIVVGWFFIAIYLAHTYNTAIAEKRVVC